MKYFIFFLLITNFCFAANDVSGKLGKDIWTSVDILSKIEGINIFESMDNQVSFKLESISCVFEQYYACSFFTKVDGERKLIVTLDGSLRFMQSLVNAGAKLDEESPRLDLNYVSCIKNNNEFICNLE